MLLTALLLLTLLAVAVGGLFWIRDDYRRARERAARAQDPELWEQICAENDRPLTNSILGYSDGRERQG